MGNGLKVKRFCAGFCTLLFAADCGNSFSILYTREASVEATWRRILAHEEPVSGLKRSWKLGASQAHSKSVLPLSTPCVHLGNTGLTNSQFDQAPSLEFHTVMHSHYCNNTGSILSSMSFSGTFTHFLLIGNIVSIVDIFEKFHLPRNKQKLLLDSKNKARWYLGAKYHLLYPQWDLQEKEASSGDTECQIFPFEFYVWKPPQGTSSFWFSPSSATLL